MGRAGLAVHRQLVLHSRPENPCADHPRGAPRDRRRMSSGARDLHHASVRILGIRGIPGRHGGFESFAEDLAIYLVKRGWAVTVYCQEKGGGLQYETAWQGVRRVHIPVRQSGSLGTVLFDW